MDISKTSKSSIILILLLALFAPLALSAQDNQARRKQRPDTTSMTAEERKEALAKRINDIVVKYVDEMGKDAPTDELLNEFSKVIARAQLERFQLTGKMRQLREGKTGRPDREAMMQLREEGEAIDTTMLNSMKEILSKKQLKAFKKAKDKVEPPRENGRGQRGGGGGGGNRGGGGGGGS